jgi:hypothetical protein
LIYQLSLFHFFWILNKINTMALEEMVVLLPKLATPRGDAMGIEKYRKCTTDHLIAIFPSI